MRKVPLHEQPIARIESISDEGILVRLVDGTEMPCRRIFFAPGLTQACSVPERLGSRIMPGGEITMGKMGETTLPGVYVAGDAGRDGSQLIIAAADGSVAAIGINTELLDEDWEKQ